MARQDDYITEARNSARKVWAGLGELLNLQREWNALSYGDNLADGAGLINGGITKSMVGAVVFDTANAIKTVMDNGSATNVAKLL